MEMAVITMADKLFKHIVDAIDIETFILCDSEDEGKRIMLDFVSAIGLTDSDIVFIEFSGLGARIRARGYAYRPGDSYQWLDRYSNGGETENE
jgi:hypothetical protein